tara:strand:- start:1276 stop:2019 length:744 start_codon:yes stop_codon:yes gene_type:complete
MEQENKFPTEIIDLPSKGLLYPKDSPLSSGKIEMKYMTAKEEDILTNQNYITRGTVIDKLIQALVVDKSIKYGDILAGDKNVLLVAARILGYGENYEFEYNGEKHTVDLSKLDNKPIDDSLFETGKNEFTYSLPTSGKNITFKLLTHQDDLDIDQEIKGLKKVNKDSSAEMSTRLKYIIQSVDGKVDQKTIRNFVDNEFLARDARAFRNYYASIQPDLDLTFYPENGPEEGVDIPIGINFLWPDANL